MSEDVKVLPAHTRDSVGKGTARAIRRNEEVPAVIYGNKKAPVTISMESKIIERHANKVNFLSTLFDIEIEGKKHRVLPRDVQFHPVSDRVLHVDFLRVSKNTKVRVSVPLSFINQEKSPGIKRGGTLNIVYHELEVLCSPEEIPDNFSVDLAKYPLGAAIRSSTIELPKGMSLTAKEKDFTIASISIPSAVRKAIAEEAAAAAKAAEAEAAAGKKK